MYAKGEVVNVNQFDAAYLTGNGYAEEYVEGKKKEEKEFKESPVTKELKDKPEEEKVLKKTWKDAK